MWKKIFAGLFVIFRIVCVRSDDGKNQQTFVVRYKNGDQTIPVTVVLDYKKQTEYVINMSPRTSAKSVTLYDFKQRTIAYKDLTNRECFLGRLTHETLTEESDALNRIQNPVDHKPKILSLDPQKTALSPTEIRNVAGQKTAVFCRKMNTWLILPKESHSIRKRDVDDEVDERTYHRHGYHTVRYSHYGHETRRRYRNSNRNASRQLSHRNKGAHEIPKVAYLDLEEGGASPHHQTEIQSPVSNYDARFVDESSMNYPPQQHNRHHTHHHLQKEDSRLDSHSTIPPTSYYEDNPIVSQDSKTYLSHRRLSLDTESHPLTSDVGFSDSDSNMLSSLFENSTDVENSLFRNDDNSSSLNPIVETRKSIIPKVYPEPSIYNTGILEHNIYSPGQSGREPEFYSSGKNGYIPVDRSEIETESFSNELSPQAPENTAYPKIDIEQAHENGDISTTFLEVPKITKKFDNLENEQGHEIFAQPNEDLHDVFEGFYNLRGSYPPSEHNSLHSSHSIPLQINHAREKSFLEEPLIQSNPLLPQNTFREFNESNWRRRGNVYSSPESQETSSTDSPVLTTTFYDYNRHPTTSYSTDTVTTVPYIHTSRNKLFPHQFGQRYPNKRYDTTLRSIAVSSGAVYDDNTGNSIQTTSVPTLVPFHVRSDFENSNHRSDIPSESDPDEIIENITSATTDTEQIDRNNQYGPSVVPTTIVKEGIPLHHQRFHNILRQYKPEQIIIDIESIPTRLPPDSSLGFQQRTFPTTEKSNNPLSHSILTTNPIRSEQTSETRRSNPTQSNWNAIERRNNQFSNGVNTHRRNNIPPQTSRRSDPNFRRYLPTFNNIPHQQQHQNFPSQFSNQLSHFNQLHIGSLPPGVSSIHPRHPKAPYADMFHPNVLQPVYQDNSYRTLKPHRQRHHRKKGRFQPRHSCCGLSGKDGKLSSCCRDGGECCSSIHRDDRRIPIKTSCCSGRSSQVRIPKAHSPRISNPHPSRFAKEGLGTLPLQRDNRRSSSPPEQHHSRTVEDKRNPCEKQKMCRTLYESTQQVMVCRNAEIEGC